MSTIVTNHLAAPINNAAQTAAAASSSSSTPTTASSLSTEFLQLLIAQLKNQDPQNPADGTTFVTQLATFTDVQANTQSATDLGSILTLLQQAAAPPVAPSTAPSGTTPGATTNPATGTTGTASTTGTTGA